MYSSDYLKLTSYTTFRSNTANSRPKPSSQSYKYDHQSLNALNNILKFITLFYRESDIYSEIQLQGLLPQSHF